MAVRQPLAFIVAAYRLTARERSRFVAGMLAWSRPVGEVSDGELLAMMRAVCDESRPPPS